MCVWHCLYIVPCSELMLNSNNIKLILKNTKLTTQWSPYAHSHINTPFPAPCNNTHSGYWYSWSVKKSQAIQYPSLCFSFLWHSVNLNSSHASQKQKSWLNPDKFECFVFISFISSLIMQSGASGGRPQRAGMHAKNAGTQLYTH